MPGIFLPPPPPTCAINAVLFICSDPPRPSPPPHVGFAPKPSPPPPTPFPQVGILAPEPHPTGQLLCGQVGYIVPGIKSIKAVRVGDTLHHYKK